jgi:hypothetical protein
MTLEIASEVPTFDENNEEQGRRRSNALHAKIAVLLHLNTFDILLLVLRVLPLALTAPVKGDLTVALHLELDGTIVAPEAVARE